ncbi:MAG: GTPase HflX [Candidatus Hydrothermales bacterium]
MSEKVILAAVFKPKEKEVSSYKLSELESLVKTAGATITSEVIQFREKIDPDYCLGKGKLAELKEKIVQNSVNTVIFGVDLSPKQTRNLEEFLKVKVIDRTELIMDIFAKHAKTKESKLQVELAQLLYRLTKLKGMGKWLSRLGGGIGTRGPGEKMLEIKKRNILLRIKHLKEKLKEIEKQRDVQSKKRKNFFKVCLIGYTNVGKTSLLNLITREKAETKDALFVTLDALTRKFYIDGIPIILSDTVGFIEDIPVSLIHSFKSTLKVILDADLLLHVVDVSNPMKEKQIESVNKVLSEIGVHDKDIIYVFNKYDLFFEEEEKLYLKNKYKPAVFVSAKFGDNIDLLIENIKLYALKYISEKQYGGTIN